MDLVKMDAIDRYKVILDEYDAARAALTTPRPSDRPGDAAARGMKLSMDRQHLLDAAGRAAMEQNNLALAVQRGAGLNHAQQRYREIDAAAQAAWEQVQQHSKGERLG